MRILMSIHHHLDADSGAAGSTLRLKREYESLGHCVQLFSYDDLPSAMSIRTRNVVFPWALNRHILKELRRNGLDVIDGSTGDAWVWARFRRRRTQVIPALVTRSTGLEHTAYQSFLQSHYDGTHPLTWRFRMYHGAYNLLQVRESLRRSDLCMFLNETDREFALTHLGIEAERVRIVPNGISQKLIGLPLPPSVSGETLRVAMLGNFIQIKGVDYAIPALVDIMTRRPEVQVSFLGIRVDESQVYKRFDSCFHQRIRVVKHYSHDSLPALLHGHHIQLIASVYEGFCKTLLEGMACGLATVTTAVPGPLSIVRDGWDALVVPPRDSGALAGAVERLIADRPMMLRVAQNGYNTAQKYSWRRAATLRLAGYEDVINTRRQLLDHRGALGVHR